MKKLFTLAMLTILANVSKANSVPHGTFKCPIKFTENYELTMVPGNDFPSLSQTFESPKVRQEELKLEFSLNGSRPNVLLHNPESLPNWLLVTSPFYHQQSSFYSQTATGAYFEINWHGNWYFGSSLSFIVLKLQNDELVIDLTFDDNDGTELHFEELKCQK